MVGRLIANSMVRLALSQVPINQPGLSSLVLCRASDSRNKHNKTLTIVEGRHGHTFCDLAHCFLFLFRLFMFIVVIDYHHGLQVQNVLYLINAYISYPR